jgi:hypothetical protein
MDLPGTQAMGWSRVIKTINGHSYVYEQRTWREGRRVRADSRFVGKEARASGILFHGSRDGIRGRLRPSENATFGPGFYLATRKEAERYARTEPRFIGDAEADAPRYWGTVYAFNSDGLNLLVLKDYDAYLRLAKALVQGGDLDLERAKIALQELWERQGYDGLSVLDPRKPAVVVFPAAIGKLGGIVESYRID